MPLSVRRNRLLFFFWGFFVANAIIAELISVKLFDAGAAFGLQKDTFIMALGLLPWPLVFISTDLLNEFYGRRVVRQMSIATAIVLIYVFLVIYAAMKLPAFQHAGVTDKQFEDVFVQSGNLIIGSIAAFMFSQFLDITLFSYFKRITNGRYIWLRATGSTVISQFLDSIIVIGIGFYLPGNVDFETYKWMVVTGYTVKLILAVLLTPFIYLGHYAVNKYLHPERTDKAQHG
ncbi:MAG: queuosine precursor transporter [Flavobacteriales bacterium]